MRKDWIFSRVNRRGYDSLKSDPILIYENLNSKSLLPWVSLLVIDNYYYETLKKDTRFYQLIDF